MTEVEKNLNPNKNFIFPSTLEDYLEKGLLMQYLYALDDKNLEMAMDFIKMDEITEVRQMILNLIKKELEIRETKRIPKFYFSYDYEDETPRIPFSPNDFVRTEKRTLTLFLAAHKLTDFLQTLTDSELIIAERNLRFGELDSETIDIQSAIQIEQEYRAQAKAEQNQKVVK